MAHCCQLSRLKNITLHVTTLNSSLRIKNESAFSSSSPCSNPVNRKQIQRQIQSGVTVGHCKIRHRREIEMKITALLVLKCVPEGADPVILANASDVSHFGYFQRSSIKEFIVFVGRTVAKRTPPSQRQLVQQEGPISSFPFN